MPYIMIQLLLTIDFVFLLCDVISQNIISYLTNNTDIKSSTEDKDLIRHDTQEEMLTPDNHFHYLRIIPSIILVVGFIICMFSFYKYINIGLRNLTHHINQWFYRLYTHHDDYNMSDVSDVEYEFVKHYVEEPTRMIDTRSL